MTRVAIVTLLILGSVACISNGCVALIAPHRGPGPALDPPANSANLDPDGDFTLYVSNQSFKQPRIDIRVEIDGQIVAHNIFRVADQHNWVPFTLSLADGPHTITATSERAGVRLEKEFTVSGKQAAILDFWYSPNAETAANEKHFSFELTRHDVKFR